MKKITLVGLSVLFIFGLAACNTMQGVGEDVEAAGSAIEKKAGEKKGY